MKSFDLNQTSKYLNNWHSQSRPMQTIDTTNRLHRIASARPTNRSNTKRKIKLTAIDIMCSIIVPAVPPCPAWCIEWSTGGAFVDDTSGVADNCCMWWLWSWWLLWSTGERERDSYHCWEGKHVECTYRDCGPWCSYSIECDLEWKKKQSVFATIHCEVISITILIKQLLFWLLWGF